ncbi:MAG: sigma-E factor negative regulatory protein [Pseudomonadota bacterium]|nr:sigma-E factor negative regulatory protein [Pseudomonadota bacterium]
MSKTANDKSCEILSAFTDNESSTFEGKLSVKELLNSEDQRARWARYYIIGDALRGETPDRIDPGFSERVMREIERSPMDPAEHRGGRRGSGFLKPVASLAMAVSVAVATVLGVRALNTPDEVSVTGPIASRSTGIGPVTGASPGTSVLAPEAQVNLDRYLARHAGYAPSRGMTPYARIVGYDMDGD